MFQKLQNTKMKVVVIIAEPLVSILVELKRGLMKL